MAAESDRRSTSRLGSTQRRDEARGTITRTTITPAPGTEMPQPETPQKVALGQRFRGRAHGDNEAPRAPFSGVGPLRLVLAGLLTAMALLTVGGAILMLLLWQQNRDSGVLSSQLDRTWDLFESLRRIERVVAFAALAVATAWIALATVNVRRATGHRRNPVIAAGSLVLGVLLVWMVGRDVVADASDWVGQGAGFVLQAVMVAIPLLALLRVAQSADSRHRPMRATALLAVILIGVVQFLGGLSTIEPTADASRWGELGAYLVICALLQVLAALAANEAARAIDEGTKHRFELRHRFGESLLAQATRS